jgi:hypothetical protein
MGMNSQAQAAWGQVVPNYMAGANLAIRRQQMEREAALGALRT